MPNRLADSSSPYLLQHQHNPVDWYPWGDEAFARARQEDKPIFLSIGYSTCHWCHVMEHESFENPQVAEVLNQHFVAIKVDREERPDVDRVYMTFVQATTGAGGWPMSVWLTPALEPFYGGTYYPPTSRWGRPGFVQVLEEIARVWREQRTTVLESAADIVTQLRGFRPAGAGPAPGPDVLEQTTREFAEAFDHRRGGFGDAPKFPRPSELLFLLREHARTGAPEARDMVLGTLQAMARGGMRDHLGGGFHRYSVDGEWRVPHFEKMLYDQAQLVLAYLEAGQLTGDPAYLEVAADTLAYVRRDLRDRDGGFYSAEDADSVPAEQAHLPEPPRREGAFYVWRDDEIADVAGQDADLVRLYYGIQPGGNAPSDPHGEFTGLNVLYIARPVDEVAAASGRPLPEVSDALARARQQLLARRAARPRPHLDDKVLTAWNGLMIAAAARASRVLDHGSDAYADARAAALFIRTHLWDPARGTLRRRYRRGDAGIDGYAEDYACLIAGLLELFQADGDPAWLEWALALQETLDGRFWDAADGGWFSTTGEDASVLLRLKEDYDGAEPAASSVAVLNLITLSHLLGDSPAAGAAADGGYAGRIARTFGLMAARSGRSGRTVPLLLAALSTYHAGMMQVVIAGERDAPDTQALYEVVRRQFHPASVVIPLSRPHRERVEQLLPWTAALQPRDGRATAYVCRAFTCLAPATSAEALRTQLETRPRA